MSSMHANSNQELLQQRIGRLTHAMAEIRRNMEKLMAENQRLREVVRLAESELRNRRDQVHRLENEITRLNGNRLEARGRVDSAIEKLEQLMQESGEGSGE